MERPGWPLTLGLLALMALTSQTEAADYIRWDRERQRVDASVQKWDTMQVLRRVATATRWQVYVEPGIKQILPTRFRNLSEGDALQRLLGDLNFAHLPPSNGVPRLFVFRTKREDATLPVRGLEGAQARIIEDELILKLKPGESIDEVAKRLGATVTGRLDDKNAYRLKFKDADQARAARESLLKDSSVASVDYNYSILQPESADGLNAPAPRFSLQPKAPADGKEVIIGLIDSAVQPKEGKFANFLLEPISVASGSQAASETPTHGTAMTETILNGLASVLEKNSATTVKILPVDVYGDSATTSTFDVAIGIYKAVNAGAKIINLSMGSEGESSLLHEVVQSSHDQGVIFFAAAGNEPVTTPVHPAAWPETTAVTALDRSGAVASYANRGDFVKAGGPGTVLISFNDQTYVISGTSASTAYVSGVAAALAETTGKPPIQIEKSIPELMPVKRP